MVPTDDPQHPMTRDPDPVDARLADVRAGFDEFQDYDGLIHRILPGYSEMLDTVESLVAFQRPTPRVILELGIGTGGVAERLLSAMPDLALIGVDFSETMLARAERRLAAYRDRLTLLEGDLRTFEVPAPDVDGAVSCLAVHHLDDDDKRALFVRLGRLIPAGGLFVLGDVVSLPERLADWARVRRLARMRELGAGTDFDADRWIDAGAENDRPASLEAQVGWLRDAGFGAVASVWQEPGAAVIGAIR